MLDIRQMLSGVGVPIAEESFYTAPPLPYLIFMEQRTVRGSDLKNKIVDQVVTLELYTDKLTPEIEHKVELILNQIPVEFTRDRMWLSTEKMYETLYTFSAVGKL